MEDRTLLPGWDVAPGEATPQPDGTVPSAPGTFGLRILNVSEVARAIREAVRAEPLLSDLWVEGEVGRVTVSSAGHAYFTLKDARSTLNCVWFSDERARSVFQPQAGLRIVAHGRVDLFEQLKARLAAEGLFEQGRKRPLPTRPTTIAVITSPTGVVWRDIATVLSRRWPLTTVLLVACKVQGDDAPESIVRAFRRLERWIAMLERDGRAAEAPQLTILARVGRSLEDLWSFNDERVVRAVVAHRLPVVCGVGHEVDVTLADFAADVRAATPSAAAELVVPDRADWLASFRRAGDRTAAAVSRTLDSVRRELAVERRALDRLDPRAQLVADRERVGLLLDRAVRVAVAAIDRRTASLRHTASELPRPILERLAAARTTLATSTSALAVLGPQATLDRGYAIVRRTIDGEIVRRGADASTGTLLLIRVAEGEVAAESRGSPDSTG